MRNRRSNSYQGPCLNVNAIVCNFSGPGVAPGLLPGSFVRFNNGLALFWKVSRYVIVQSSVEIMSPIFMTDKGIIKFPNFSSRNKIKHKKINQRIRGQFVTSNNDEKSRRHSFLWLRACLLCFVWLVIRSGILRRLSCWTHRLDKALIV